MKARFDQTPFQPLALSHAERQRFQRLADEILRGVLRDVDHMGAPRVFSKSRWKELKTHDNCTVYQDRVKTSSSGSSGSSSAQVAASTVGGSAALNCSGSSHSDGEPAFDEEGADWKMPELVVSGSVPGTLEDVLYGMTAHDSADMMLRTAYVDDNWLDAAVLYQIEMPTPADPFRFLGVKWYIKGMPLKYKSVVLPRDFVFLEASGLHTRADGSRVGYFLRHPVDLAACPELTQHGVLRGRFTSYAIYTPLPELGAVDLFVRGKAAPSGKMALKIATMVTANSLLSAMNGVFCSYSKKLTWVLRSATADSARKHASAASAALLAETAVRCVVCIKKFGRLSAVVTCSICGERICSRCRIWRSLSFVNTRRRDQLHVQEMAGTFCKNCVSQANASSAMEIARQEILSGRYGPVVAAEDVELPRETTTAAAAAAIAESEIVYVDASSSNGSSEHAEDEDELRDGVQREWAPAIPYAVEHVYAYEDPDHDVPLVRRQKLWCKMAALRDQAEHVYEMTKKTSDLHLHGNGSGSNSTETYDSDADDLD